jgi:thioesterase domain-containing protein
MRTPDEITAYLHDHIPISRHLGVAVWAYDGESIRLGAPLAPNVNHRSTAFGGSLSALAILSGWALLHLKLREHGIENRLVIQGSTFDFQEPVRGDFVAVSSLPPARAWDRFLATLARHHRARVTVPGIVECEGVIGGSHEGVYVAMRGLAEEG